MNLILLCKCNFADVKSLGAFLLSDELFFTGKMQYAQGTITALTEILSRGNKKSPATVKDCGAEKFALMPLLTQHPSC